MSRSRTELVIVSARKGYKIYDTEKCGYIGFQKILNYNGVKVGGTKELWNSSGAAKSAFKLHTGTRIDDQTRYGVREVGDESTL